MSLIPQGQIPLILDVVNGNQSSRTKLRTVIKDYKRLHLPTMVSEKTIRRWLYHYLLFGETPEETARWRKKNTKRRYNSKWDDDDTETLRHIIEEYPELYLDEIQAKLANINGKSFTSSTIYKHSIRIMTIKISV